MENFWLCFVPLFIAVDPPGILPMFTTLTHSVARDRKRRLILASALTAAVVAIGFLFAGDSLLRYMGIEVADFTIAGGLILLILSVSDLVSPDKPQRRVDPDSLGAVPIGVPLMVGPAVLTTSLLLRHQFGALPTAAALMANVVLAALSFLAAGFFQRVLGRTGEKVLSKLASLLLAALAVMLIRKGIAGSVWG